MQTNILQGATVQKRMIEPGPEPGKSDMRSPSELSSQLNRTQTQIALSKPANNQNHAHARDIEFMM